MGQKWSTGDNVQFITFGYALEGITWLSIVPADLSQCSQSCEPEYQELGTGLSLPHLGVSQGDLAGKGWGGGRGVLPGYLGSGRPPGMQAEL